MFNTSLSKVFILRIKSSINDTTNNTLNVKTLLTSICNNT